MSEIKQWGDPTIKVGDTVDISNIQEQSRMNKEEFRKHYPNVNITESEVYPCAMHRWISVKDRLPTVSKRYLVIHLDDNNAWNDDRLGFSSFFVETKEFNHDNIGWWFDIPTLPESPK